MRISAGNLNIFGPNLDSKKKIYSCKCYLGKLAQWIFLKLFKRNLLQKPIVFGRKSSHMEFEYFFMSNRAPKDYGSILDR